MFIENSFFFNYFFNNSELLSVIFKKCNIDNQNIWISNDGLLNLNFISNILRCWNYFLSFFLCVVRLLRVQFEFIVQLNLIYLATKNFYVRAQYFEFLYSFKLILIDIFEKKFRVNIIIFFLTFSTYSHDIIFFFC